MSFKFLDRSFPIKPQPISDAELAEIVAAALREDFGETPSTIKHIGQLTGARLRTIKNWFEARNAPSSGHLLLLARSSPALLKFIIEQIGGDDLWDAFNLLGNRATGAKTAKNAPKKGRIYSAEFCTINFPKGNGSKHFNQRQMWFLESLKQGDHCKADDIAKTWKVSPRTAKYDIAKLMNAGLVQFVGAKKTGCYELKE